MRSAPIASPRRTAIAFLLLAVVVFWLARVLLPVQIPRTFGSDIVNYHYPNYVATYRDALDGFPPLWDPTALLGVPWLATLQGGYLYPFHVLHAVLPIGAAMALSGVVHLALAALSTFVLARRIGLGLASGCLAAVLFALRGGTPMLFWEPNYLEAAAWLSTGCVGVWEFARGRLRAGSVWVAVSSGASWLAGFPQATVYALYAWSLWLVCLLVASRPRDVRRWLAAGGGLALGLLLGGLLAAPQLFPTAELVAHATRELGGASLAASARGPHSAPSTLIGVGSVLLQRQVVPELPLSLGATLVCLLPAALANSRLRGVALACLTVAGFFVTVGLGRLGPAFSLYESLPLLTSFRFPIRALFVLDLFLALAAAIGLDALIRAPGVLARSAEVGAPRPWGRAARALVGAASLLSSAALGFAGHPVSAVAAFALLLLVLSSSLALWRSRAVAFAGPAVVVIALGEILFTPPFESRQGLHYDEAFYQGRYAERAIFEPLAGSSERVWIASHGGNPAIPPRAGLVFGWRSIGGYEPLNLRRQSQYFRFLETGVSEPAIGATRPFDGNLALFRSDEDLSALRARGRLIDLTGARWLLCHCTGEFGERVAAFTGEAAWPLVRSEGDLKLYENPRVLPRAFVAERTAPAPGPDALLSLLSDPAFDPRALSFVEGSLEQAASEPVRVADAGRPPKPGRVRIVTDGSRLVVLDVELDAPGLVVLADTFYPGWTATVDGEPEPVIATNHLFRGVAVPEGAHRVSFAYRSTYLGVGIWAGAVGALGTVLLALSARGRRSPAPTTPTA